MNKSKFAYVTGAALGVYSATKRSSEAIDYYVSLKEKILDRSLASMEFSQESIGWHRFDKINAWLEGHRISGQSRHLKLATSDLSCFTKGSYRISVDGVKYIVVSGEDNSDPEKRRYNGANIKIMARRSSDIANLFEAIKRAIDPEESLFITRGSYGFPNLVEPEFAIYDTDLVREIVDDIREAADNSDAYRRLGIPYKRSYLITGPPGTGKSTLIKAVLKELSLDAMAIQVSRKRHDPESMFIDPFESVIIWEDVDVNVPSRESKPGEWSLSDALSAMDAIGEWGTSNDLPQLLFMTSNYPEKIDSAVLRTGRCDKTYRVGYATHRQLSKVVEKYTGEVHDFTGMRDDVPMSDIVEILKGYIGDMVEAIPAIKEFVAK